MFPLDFFYQLHRFNHYLTSNIYSSTLLYYSVQDVEAVEEEGDSSEAGRQPHLLLQGESQQPQLLPVRLLNSKLLHPCRPNLLPLNKAGECSRELVLPSPRVWHSELDLQLLTVPLVPWLNHLVEVVKLPQRSSNNNQSSSMPLLPSNHNLLGLVQMIRRCSLIA